MPLDRRRYRGVSHAACNRSAGATKRNGTANTKPPLIWSKQWGSQAPPGHSVLLNGRLYGPGEGLDVAADINIV